MDRSIARTSTSVVLTSSMASRPLLASPTTRKSTSEEKYSFQPARMTAWSATITIQIISAFRESPIPVRRTTPYLRRTLPLRRLESSFDSRNSASDPSRGRVLSASARPPSRSRSDREQIGNCDDRVWRLEQRPDQFCRSGTAPASAEPDIEECA